MRIELNYKKEHFVQIFPLFFITNGKENVVLIGLGYTNIAFVFGKNDVSEIPNSGKDLKQFTFIWYKKMENNNVTHYTEPFRTTLKAKNREEAVEKVTQFALKKMTLCIHEDGVDFDKSDYMKIQRGFDITNKMMDSFFKKTNYYK